ncbi:MAG: polymorphic toxin type 28 domain-containing protein [Pseudonocardiaceae bacterium]
MNRRLLRIAVSAVGVVMLLGFAGVEAGAVPQAPQRLSASTALPPTNPPGPCNADEIGQTRIGPDGKPYVCVPGGTDSSGVDNRSSQESTKTHRISEHLTQRDLDAAKRETDGEVVARKPDGTPFDHVKEVRDAQRGLLNRIEDIKRRLGDTRIPDEARAVLESELSRASRLLDYSETYLPRQ